MLDRTRMLAMSLAVAGATAIGFATQGHAESVVRIGMTAADIPVTTGAPSQGGEGLRFTGFTMYDGLVNWDLSRSDVSATIVPALATEWNIDPKDKTKWIFKLRKGVKFHDGSDFNADAVIFNFGKILDKKSPQFDPKARRRFEPAFPA